MKKVVLLCCTLAAMFFVSCEKSNESGYEGTNYILASSTETTILDTEDAKLDVKFELTSSLDADLTLHFTVNDTEDIITLDPESVVIKAGEKNASLTVKVKKAIEENSMNFSLGLDKTKTSLPEKVVWSEDFKFTVKSSKVDAPTAEQQAIIDAYKTATGIDLSKYIGIVKCEMTLTYRDYDLDDIVVTADPLSTHSVIELGESSTAEAPVLNMVSNAMGVNQVMYNNLRKLTVDSEEWAYPSAEGEEKMEWEVLCELISWNKTSDEQFETSLNGIKLGETIEFYTVGTDEYGEPFGVVPFEFYFSAYERELDKNWVPEYYTTSNPAEWLNLYDISTDYIGWTPEKEESEETSLWEEASASISAEKMEFTFCFSDENYSDYAKVHVVYTPNE